MIAGKIFFVAKTKREIIIMYYQNKQNTKFYILLNYPCSFVFVFNPFNFIPFSFLIKYYIRNKRYG